MLHQELENDLGQQSDLIAHRELRMDEDELEQKQQNEMRREQVRPHPRHALSTCPVPAYVALPN